MAFGSRKMLLLLGTALLVASSLAEESPPEKSDETKEVNYDEQFREAYSVLPPLKPIPNNIPDMKNLPPPKLPDMTNGGVMVYFHLYKTGGSSITELMLETKADLEEDLTEYEEESIYFYNQREELTGDDILESVEIAKNKKMAVFYNFHVEFPSTMYPTLVEAAPIFNAWREYSESQGIPFFLATVVREPLGHSLSFFNFFHVAVDQELSEWSPFIGDLQPTEENFLKTYVPNRMCHLMYDDAHGILEAPDFALREGLLEDIHEFMDEEEYNRRNEPSHCDVDVVRNILFGGTFDYVGVTDRISKHILPMFMKIVFGDENLADESEQRKDVNKIFEIDQHALPPLKKNALSEATKEKVLKESAKDQQIYEEARDRFAHWPKFFSWPEDADVKDEESGKNEKDDTSSEASGQEL